jgi:cold shock CspA family protein
MIGNVRKFFLDKGYGFVVDAEGVNHFFHITNFERPGAEGDERKPKLGESVTFEVSEAAGEKPQAVDVRPFEP